jgi:hypothetical protein
MNSMKRIYTPFKDTFTTLQRKEIWGLLFSRLKESKLVNV